MKNFNNSNTLGSGQISQRTIGEFSKIDQIEGIFLENMKVIENLSKKNPTKYKKIIISDLKKFKKLPIKINKHIELYVLKNKLNIEKIFNYVEFRFKFEQCGTEKINLGYPPYLLIEPVSSCNLRCPFCFQTDKSFTKKPFMGVMDFEFFKEIIDEADKIGVGAITIASRGEPTMHKKFCEMLDYTAEKNNFFEVKINTNGSFLNEKICHAIFKNEITQIVISADHYEKAKFEKLRLNSKFDNIVNNVDLLYAIRKKFYPNSITEIRVSGIDAEKNLDKDKFRDFWIKRSDHVTASLPLERWDTYNNLKHSNINDPCENLWDRMYIWYDGKANPCDADYKSYLSYGNKKNSSIKEIWNSKIIKQLRNDHINNKRNCHNPCDRCGVTFS